MKFKHVVASLSLAMFTAFGVAAGLSMKKEAKEVKADDPKTAMFSLTLNATALEAAYETSNYRAHVWGTDIDEYVSMHQSGQEHVYTVIITLTDAQVVEGAQFIFTQSDGEYPGEKYSHNLNLFAEGYYDVSKDHNNGASFSFVSTTNWDGEGHWTTSDGDRYVMVAPKVGHTPHIGTADTWYNFILEPENARYAYYDMEIDERYTDMISFKYPGSTASTYFHPYYMFNSYAKECTNETGGSDYWTYLDDAGTYDIFIENYFDGEGIISIRKHEESESWIYYMTESNSATGDYIYSWGGSSQFGSFPGKAITSIDGVQEVTKGGLIHFQGYDRLIYKIPITKGYPNGDDMFMFNNGTDAYKSAEREIKIEHAYWWSGEANHLAAQAFGFMILVETYRTQIEDGSICSIPQGNAKFIVDSYNAYTQAEQETYIDRSTLLTWKDSKKVEEEKEYVSYRKIVEQLAIIAGVELEGSSLHLNKLDFANNGNVAIIVIAVAATSALALTLLLVFKKRKHE